MKIKKSNVDKKAIADIANRVIEVLKDLPGNLKTESEKLGYASPSTIYKVKKGAALPDIVKLQKLAERELSGKRPNIDWVVTGKGDRMVSVSEDDSLVKTVQRKLVGQSPDRLNAILTLLENSPEDDERSVSSG